LIDSGLPLNDLAHALKAIPLGGYRLRSANVMRSGLRATKVRVVIDRGLRAPLSLKAIHRLIASSRIPAEVKEQGHAAFDRLAHAEGLAHRTHPGDVAFHEVGVIDSCVDVLGSLLGCRMLGIDRVSAGPINLGAGMIDSSHGILPAPGPAVAQLAHGLPVYSAGPQRELTTPTGLALLTTLARDFGPMPLMRLTAVGYGAGDADDRTWPNVLRVFIGETSQEIGEVETIVQLEANLDDVPPQTYDTVIDRLFAAGALDVTLTPVIMKQGRPGIVLTVLAHRQKAQAAMDTMFRETSTLGVRTQEVSRRILPRHSIEVRTPDGPVRMKVAAIGSNGTKASPEYQDCKRIAQQTGRPVREIMEEAVLAYRLRTRTASRARSRKKGRA
jgi:uncharacterized protein (TIGR00299 family) protein